MKLHTPVGGLSCEKNNRMKAARCRQANCTLHTRSNAEKDFTEIIRKKKDGESEREKKRGKGVWGLHFIYE